MYNAWYVLNDKMNYDKNNQKNIHQEVKLIERQKILLSHII